MVRGSEIKFKDPLLTERRMPKYKLSITERFSSKYIKTPNGCWEWDGALRADGYGILKVNGKCLGAHRFSYELYKGEIPFGLNVLHDCDNAKCVNPDHLYAGTAKQNNEDRFKRNRHSIKFNSFHILKISKETGLNYSKYHGYINDTITRFMRINNLPHLEQQNVTQVIDLIISISKRISA